MTNKEPKEEKIDRFIISLIDTWNIIPGPNGDQYYSINLNAPKISDYNKLIPKAKRTNYAKTELQSMFVHFQEVVDAFDLDKTKELINTPIEEDDGKTIK